MYFNTIYPVHPKRNQSWVFIGRTDAEAETLVLWPPDAKNWLTGKDPDAGKDGRQEEKGMTEDEMVEWHQWLNGHELEQALGVGDGQGGQACCSLWSRKESEYWATEQQQQILSYKPLCFMNCFSSSLRHILNVRHVLNVTKVRKPNMNGAYSLSQYNNSLITQNKFSVSLKFTSLNNLNKII